MVLLYKGESIIRIKCVFRYAYSIEKKYAVFDSSVFSYPNIDCSPTHLFRMKWKIYICLVYIVESTTIGISLPVIFFLNRARANAGVNQNHPYALSVNLISDRVQ